MWCLIIWLFLFFGAVTARPADLFHRDPDAIYFPDQLEYIKAGGGGCQDQNLLYWPGDQQCYAEGTQGPCPSGFRLIWETRFLRPKCHDAQEDFLRFNIAPRHQ